MKRILLFILVVFSVVCLFGCSDFDNTYENCEKYSIGGEIIKDAVSSVSVNWAAGNIDLVSYDGTDIIIEENSSKSLSKAQKVHWLCENGNLDIRYTESGYVKLIGGMDKRLVVKIPQTQALSRMSISCTSTDVSANGIDWLFFSCSSTSGKKNIVLSGNQNSTSVSGTSGRINLSLEKSDNIVIKNTSGDVNLAIGEDSPFNARIDRSSGSFNCEFATVQSGNRYICPNAKTAVSIETASGDIKISKR